MKKLTFLMVAMSFVVVFSNQVQADMKVAVFDAQKVIDNIDEGKSAVTALEKEAGEKKKLMEKKQKELLELKSEIDRGALVFDKDTMAKKQQDFAKKQQEFQKFYMEAQGEIQKQELEMRSEIFKKITAVIEKMGKSEAYDFVLEKNEGGVIFAKSGDITDKVIEMYNKVYKKEEKSKEGKKEKSKPLS